MTAGFKVPRKLHVYRELP